MLNSYLRNSQVAMTKDAYFEMCEMLGNEPVDSEIPVEPRDFPDEIKTSLMIYGNLRDDWDYMNGEYLGKNLSILFNLMEVMHIDKSLHYLIFTVIKIIDSIRSDIFKSKKAANKK